MPVTAIGLDLAKHVFQVHGADRVGTVVLRRRLRRTEVLKFFSSLPSCLVGMEACSTAHSRTQAPIMLGHDVRLMLVLPRTPRPPDPPAYHVGQPAPGAPCQRSGSSSLEDGAELAELLGRIADETGTGIPPLAHGDHGSNALPFRAPSLPPATACWPSSSGLDRSLLRSPPMAPAIDGLGSCPDRTQAAARSGPGVSPSRATATSDAS
jgi:hypothetical protein